MAETLSLLSIIAFIVAGVCLILAIFLWVVLRIPTVIGDLSGRTARKSIARIRATNEKSGNKKYNESKVNVSRGKLTGTMPDVEKKSRPVTPPPQVKPKVDSTPETQLLGENKVTGYETEETGMLESDATGLLTGENETALLGMPEQKTVEPMPGKQLTMLDNVMLIHTDEVI